MKLLAAAILPVILLSSACGSCAGEAFYSRGPANELRADRVLPDDGTAALPSYTFNDDADTGIYRLGANNIGFTSGGTLVLDVSASELDLNNALSIVNIDDTNSDFGSYTVSFDAGSLDDANDLSVTHSLGSKYVNCRIFSNLDVSDNSYTSEYTAASANALTVDLTGKGVTNGTWNIRCTK